jgi:hypothetical protein
MSAAKDERRSCLSQHSHYCHVGAAEPSREYLAAAHFLRSEVAAAAAAVAALDRFQLKLNSFQDKGMELLDEAHR